MNHLRKGRFPFHPDPGFSSYIGRAFVETRLGIGGFAHAASRAIGVHALWYGVELKPKDPRYRKENGTRYALDIEGPPAEYMGLLGSAKATVFFREAKHEDLPELISALEMQPTFVLTWYASGVYEGRFFDPAFWRGAQRLLREAMAPERTMAIAQADVGCLDPQVRVGIAFEDTRESVRMILP